MVYGSVRSFVTNTITAARLRGESEREHAFHTYSVYSCIQSKFIQLWVVRTIYTPLFWVPFAIKWKGNFKQFFFQCGLARKSNPNCRKHFSIVYFSCKTIAWNIRHFCNCRSRRIHNTRCVLLRWFCTSLYVETETTGKKTYEQILVGSFFLCGYSWKSCNNRYSCVLNKQEERRTLEKVRFANDTIAHVFSGGICFCL